MKISIFFATVSSKAITTEFEDMNSIANQLKLLTNQNSRMNSDEVQDQILRWEFDAFDATQTSKSEMPNHEVQAILSRGNILNQFAMFSIVNGPDDSLSEERGYSSPQDKFNRYGCYCSPHSIHSGDDTWVGKGDPVDEIDTECRHLFLAYKCLEKDHGSKCNSSKAYAWEVDNNGDIKCLDKKGSCKGDLCRLDLDFTKALSSLNKFWEPAFHMDNGFDRKSYCSPSGGGNGGSGYQKPNNKDPVQTECCGKSLRRHMFNPARLQCCKDGSTKAIGSCDDKNNSY